MDVHFAFFVAVDCVKLFEERQSKRRDGGEMLVMFVAPSILPKPALERDDRGL
jgi:hypothetical protein